MTGLDSFYDADSTLENSLYPALSSFPTPRTLSAATTTLDHTVSIFFSVETNNGINKVSVNWHIMTSRDNW